MCVKRFLEDRSFAVNTTLFVTTIAIGLLSLFLISKIITEVAMWDATDDTYAANTVSVQGEGEVVAAPDVAKFTFSVNASAESVEAAQQLSAESMNKALDYLKDNNIDEKDIKTTNYYVSPKYSYGDCRGYNCPPQEPVVIGYDVNQSVEVKVRETNKAGEILSGIGTTGVTNISGLQFTIDDEDDLREEARTKAVQDARAKAEQLAKDLGVKIKKVVSFSEDSGFYPYPEAYGMGGDVAVKSSAAPSLPTGENTITIRVYVTYEIK